MEEESPICPAFLKKAPQSWRRRGNMDISNFTNIITKTVATATGQNISQYIVYALLGITALSAVSMIVNIVRRRMRRVITFLIIAMLSGQSGGSLQTEIDNIYGIGKASIQTVVSEYAPKIKNLITETK
jgi:hypothetical protein